MSKSEPWSDCFGQPAADMRMAEIHLRRAVRRARRMAEHGVPPSSIYADAARIRTAPPSRRNGSPDQPGAIRARHAPGSAVD
jgi:hypothetical protein